MNAKIDLEKFICSYVKWSNIQDALKDQGLKCWNGEIVEIPQESEDERIKEALIKFHKSTIDIDGIKGEVIIEWLEKQGIQNIIVTDEQIHWLKWAIRRLPDTEKGNEAETVLTEFVEQLEKQGAHEQVDGFDAELDALLKKYEHLSKKELQEPLEFYLGVVRDDLDVVREEKIPTWTEEDEAHLHSVTTHLEQWIERHPNTCGADIQGENLAWLKSLKQRMEE